MRLALDERQAFEQREYQTECKEAIRAARDAGLKAVLVVLPTGSGKTVIFSHLPEVLELEKKMLVIAHRAELLNQAADKIERANPDLAVYIEQAHRRAPYYADVVVASVATIGRKGSTRLSKLDPDDFGLIICDEAHHSPAKSYGIIFDHFPDAFLVGFTATPRRADGIGLEHIYQEIVFSRDLKWMIEKGYLSPVCGYSVDSGTDLSAVSTRMGDFAVNELAQAVDTDKRNQLILDSYHHLVPGQKALIFCVDVNHAHHVADMFNRTGVPAAAITGSTLALERELMLQDFTRGEIQVLSNCMVLTEGFDEPSIEAVIMARPTKSAPLYQQMIGRGMRLHPGKEKLTVVDLADNAARHSLLSLATIFGLPARFNAKGYNILEAAKKLEDLPPHVARRVRNFEDFEKLVKEVDLFAVAPERDPEVVRHSRMAWLSMPNGAYRLGLKDKQYLRIHENLLGKFIVSHCGAGVDVIGEEPNLKAALNLGDGWLVRHRQEELVLTDANASWRSKEPKQPQIDLLNRLRIPYKCDQDGRPLLTRGQASDLIGEFYAKRRR